MDKVGFIVSMPETVQWLHFITLTNLQNETDTWCGCDDVYLRGSSISSREGGEFSRDPPVWVSRLQADWPTS